MTTKKPNLRIVYCYELNECLDNIEITNKGFKEKFLNFLKDNITFQPNCYYYTILNKNTHPPIVSELFKELEIEDDEFLFEINIKQ